MYTEENKDEYEYKANNSDDNFYNEVNEDEIEETNEQEQVSPKKNKLFILAIILLIVLVILIFLLIKSCDNEEDKPTEPQILVTLSAEYLELKESRSQKLEYTVVNNKEPIQIAWLSTDETIVNVKEDGTVTALKKGTAEIIASYFINNIPYQKKCTVVVIENDGIDKQDNVKPTLKYTMSGVKDNEWTNKDAIIKIEAKDNSGVVEVKYALNCSSNCKYTNVKNNTITINTEGTTVVTIVASDKNNNSTKQTVTIKIDKTKPACSLKVDEDGKLTATYSDKGGSEIGYYGFSKDYTGNSTKEQTITTIGNYSYYIKDKAGNENNCSLTVKQATQYRYRDCTACKMCSSAGCAAYNSWKKASGTCSSSWQRIAERCVLVNGAWQRQSRTCKTYKSNCDICGGCDTYGTWSSWSYNQVIETQTRDVEEKKVFAS